MVLGAAFGATLYRELVLSGASACNMDNQSSSFILLLLFGSVHRSAIWCFRPKDRNQKPHTGRESDEGPGLRTETVVPKTLWGFLWVDWLKIMGSCGQSDNPAATEGPT
jgi:hypothetical protein